MSDWTPCMATAVVFRTKDLTAWNFTPSEKAQIVRRSGNRHGQRYVFADGSVGWVAKGSATIETIRLQGGVTGLEHVRAMHPSKKEIRT